MIKKIIQQLENARKCSKIARNICCSTRKLLGIYAAWLGLAQIFLENKLLDNAWRESHNYVYFGLKHQFDNFG